MDPKRILNPKNWKKNHKAMRKIVVLNPYLIILKYFKFYFSNDNGIIVFKSLSKRGVCLYLLKSLQIKYDDEGLL